MNGSRREDGFYGAVLTEDEYVGMGLALEAIAIFAETVVRGNEVEMKAAALADWFDVADKIIHNYAVLIGETPPEVGDEVQRDLRRFAELVERMAGIPGFLPDLKA